MSKPRITDIKGIGTTAYLSLTDEFKEVGLKQGDYVKIFVNGKKIVITALKEVA